MKNKKSVMFFAEVLIIIYHLWINISSNIALESFLRRICFIGVDIFFFLSAYSISKSEIKDYKSFIKARFLKVYLLFIIFSLIAFFYKDWSISNFLLTISGISFFLKGGGSFLWFVPAIMLVYLLLPLYKKANKLILIIIYILLIIISVKINPSILILLNRVPIIMLGYYAPKNNNLNKLSYIFISLILLIIGLFIMYKFEYINTYLNYILCIPLTLGLIMLVDLIPTNKLINILGSITLEMYCIQMLFGFKITNIVYTFIKLKLLTNIITILIIVLISYLVNYLYNCFLKKIT